MDRFLHFVNAPTILPNWLWALALATLLVAPLRGVRATTPHEWARVEALALLLALAPAVLYVHTCRGKALVAASHAADKAYDEALQGGGTR